MLQDASKSTRERVLHTLLRQHRCTINDLAEAVDINPISVRHHIAKLEAEGLVGSEEERHGVGRPRRVYFLTEDGLEHFPTRYIRLTIRLLRQLKETMPAAMVNELFSQMAQDLAEDHARSTNLSGLSMEERLEIVKDLLTDEGFDIEWERKGDQYHIREISCPYLHVGQNHPEVCRVDQTLISTVLDVPAEKIQCVLDGDTHCTYVVPNIVHSLIPSEQLS
jgi:DeoR family suf operon transcriptional repressor